MVSVNVIYIASVGVVFAALLRGIVVPVAHAGAIMATGFSVAFATYVAGWGGWLGESADIVSLVSGLGAHRQRWPCAVRCLRTGYLLGDQAFVGD